jgi:hypothetical protein
MHYGLALRQGISQSDRGMSLYDCLTSALQNKNKRTWAFQSKIPVWGKKVILTLVEWISPA